MIISQLTPADNNYKYIMCGLAGLTNNLYQQEYQGKILQCLKERGPDYNETRTIGDVTFMHSRLKIIDLSELANQPMCNETADVWMVFNGEIYNYRELRAELLADGHIFRSQTDSEVIIHLYEKEGEKAFSRLEGMFAIAIADLRKNKMFLCRDRFGIKPLFYYHKGDKLAFASNINTLKAIPGTDLSINRQAIYDFTSFLYIPAPETFYSNINSLIPGEVLSCDLHDNGVWNVTKNFFHEWSVNSLSEIEEKQALEKLEALLEQAVESQIESDVPLGALLSGGIDSSLVSAFAQHHMKKGPLRTFNVKFPDAVNDETWAAVAVAGKIGSNHLTLALDSGTGSWEELSKTLLYCGQPFADTSIFAVSRVAELVARHVTVCLSGDGGDEAFGGYSTFLQVGKMNQLLNLPAPVRALVFGISGLHPYMPASAARKLRALSYFKGQDQTGMIQGFHTWLRTDEHSRLMKGNSKYQPVRRFFEPLVQKAAHASDDILEQLSVSVTLARTCLHLPYDYLFKVDSGTMMHSIENRVPFLDEKLFAFGLSIPHRLKVRNGINKYLLRRLSEKFLPDNVVNKPKGGFGIPVDLWVDDICRKEICDSAASNKMLPEILDSSVYSKWLDAFGKKQTLPGISKEGLYQRVIMLTALNLHLK